jgi:hypothetical protein
MKSATAVHKQASSSGNFLESLEEQDTRTGSKHMKSATAVQKQAAESSDFLQSLAEQDTRTGSKHMKSGPALSKINEKNHQEKFEALLSSSSSISLPSGSTDATAQFSLPPPSNLAPIFMSQSQSQMSWAPSDLKSMYDSSGRDGLKRERAWTFYKRFVEAVKKGNYPSKTEVYGFVGKFSDGRNVAATITSERGIAFEAVKAALPNALPVEKKSTHAFIKLKCAVEKAMEKQVAPIVFVNKAMFALYFCKTD